MTTEPDLGAVVSVLRRHLPASQWHAFLFGSRVRGGARPGSDWDVGLLGPAPLRGAVVERIRADLGELRTLHRFDVVDLALVPASFRDAALRGSVPLV